jgi:hypothetical protein
MHNIKFTIFTFLNGELKSLYPTIWAMLPGLSFYFVLQIGSASNHDPPTTTSGVAGITNMPQLHSTSLTIFKCTVQYHLNTLTMLCSHNYHPATEFFRLPQLKLWTQ